MGVAREKEEETEFTNDSKDDSKGDNENATAFDPQTSLPFMKLKRRVNLLRVAVVLKEKVLPFLEA